MNDGLVLESIGNVLQINLPDFQPIEIKLDHIDQKLAETYQLMDTGKFSAAINHLYSLAKVYQQAGEFSDILMIYLMDCLEYCGQTELSKLVMSLLDQFDLREVTFH